jgi:hypothetical protein
MSTMVCQNCGSNDIVAIQGQNYCINCGHMVTDASAAVVATPKIAVPERTVPERPAKSANPNRIIRDLASGGRTVKAAAAPVPIPHPIMPPPPAPPPVPAMPLPKPKPKLPPVPPPPPARQTRTVQPAAAPVAPPAPTHRGISPWASAWAALTSARLLGLGLIFVLALALPNILTLAAYHNVAYGLRIGDWLVSLGHSATYRAATGGVLLLVSALFWSYVLQVYALGAVIYGSVHTAHRLKLWSRTSWASFWTLAGLDVIALLVYLVLTLVGAVGTGFLLFWHPTLSYLPIVVSAVILAAAILSLAAWTIIRSLAAGAAVLAGRSAGGSLALGWAWLRRYPGYLLGHALGLWFFDAVWLGATGLGYMVVLSYATTAQSSQRSWLYLELGIASLLLFMIFILINTAYWAGLYRELVQRQHQTALLAGRAGGKRGWRTFLVLLVSWLAISATAFGLAVYEQPLILQWLGSHAGL